MKKVGDRPGFLLVLSVAICGCGGGGQDLGAPIEHVLGFSGAASLPGNDPVALKACLDAQGFATVQDFYTNVADHMKTLSGPMARAEFFYTGNGQFVNTSFFNQLLLDQGGELYGWVNPIPPLEGLDAAFNDALTGLIQGNPAIRCWQLGNEPDLAWQSPDLFPAFFARAQPLVRAACPDCRLLLAGISNQYNTSDQSYQRYDGFLEAIAAAGLKGRPFDVFDLHYYKEQPKPEEIGGAVQTYRALLQAHGLDDGVAFWSTETGLYSGDPPGPDFGPRTEDDQARDLARMVSWMAAAGIERIFYWTVIEACETTGVSGFFEQMGLVFNGIGDPTGVTAGTKKKAYTTYGLLAHAIQKTRRAIRVSEGVYQFERDAGPVFVVWDEGGSGTVTLEDLAAKSIKVRELVPDSNGTTPEKTVEVTGGKAILDVDLNPKLVSLSP